MFFIFILAQNIGLDISFIYVTNCCVLLLASVLVESVAAPSGGTQHSDASVNTHRLQVFLTINPFQVQLELQSRPSGRFIGSCLHLHYLYFFVDPLSLKLKQNKTKQTNKLK